MAVKEYIGRRYAPIFGRKDESTVAWDNTKPYEELTIVTYQGNSYTSRREVPAGIDISNTVYWVETGIYNAQIEAYRTEVARYDARIRANAEDIDGLNDELDRLKLKVDDVDSIANSAFNNADTAMVKATEAYNNSNRVIEIEKGGTGGTTSRQARLNLGLAGNTDGNVMIVLESKSDPINFNSSGIGNFADIELATPSGYVVLTVTNIRSEGVFAAMYINNGLSEYAGREQPVITIAYDYEAIPNDVTGDIAVTYLCVPAGDFMKYIVNE